MNNLLEMILLKEKVYKMIYFEKTELQCGPN